MVRFVDDFVVMCPDRTTAEHTLVLVERQLATLRLTLNPQKTRIVAYAGGIEFLGQALAPRRRQGFSMESAIFIALNSGYANTLNDYADQTNHRHLIDKTDILPIRR